MNFFKDEIQKLPGSELSFLNKKPRHFTTQDLSTPADNEAFVASINAWTKNEPIGPNCFMGQEEEVWKETLCDNPAIVTSATLSENETD